MRVIIAGSRDITDQSVVDEAMTRLYLRPTHILSGTARGVDRMGEVWAAKNKVEVLKYPANWGEYGRSAGYRRNELMAKNAEVLVAFWDGESRGTKHMIDLAKKHGLIIHVVNIGGD